IVSGDIVDYEVRQVNGGRQALVSVRAVMTDVASGLPINGAAIDGRSTIRGGDVTDETLVADAIGAAASQAVRQIQQRTLPTGTVLNTQVDRALVNQGARSGFKLGQDVIFVRQGVGQVGNGRVSRVDPDQSDVTITRYTLGIQPGDRVRVLFTPPDIRPGFSTSGTAQVARTGSRGVASSTVTALLLVGLLALLVGGGGSGGGGEAGGNFVAEPTAEAGSGNAANKLRWSGSLFGGGSRNYVKWQIWRNDVLDTPIAVVNDPSGRSYLDTEVGGRIFDWTFLNGQVGGTQCDFDEFDDQTIEDPGVPGVTPGIPYTYTLNAVYRVARADLNDGGDDNGTGGNNGGNNGGNTTGFNTGGNTGGNTTGLTTGGGPQRVRKQTSKGSVRPQLGRQEDFCYFVSSRSSTPGTATPIRRPQLTSPADNAFIRESELQIFQVTSPFTAVGADVAPEYILQFSKTRDFRNAVTIEQWAPGNTAIVASREIALQGEDIPSTYRSGDFYWRIGARNSLDNPGPVPDPATGERYIFSLPRLLKRNIIAPMKK
ncbi:MAG TPA: hypothetical protein VGE01_00330, partial [Fimbriimonas sp.]